VRDWGGHGRWRYCASRQTDRIVGVTTLKNPHPGYRVNTFAAAAAPIAGYETAPELGCVVVAKEMQGKRLSGGLVEAILKELREPAYATTDSNTMRNNLEQFGFTSAGQEWQGKRGTLSLWTFVPHQGA
jgi:predicted GNAT family N-acyltransferase